LGSAAPLCLAPAAQRHAARASGRASRRISRGRGRRPPAPGGDGRCCEPARR
jgi:hypothetical protein